MTTRPKVVWFGDDYQQWGGTWVASMLSKAGATPYFGQKLENFPVLEDCVVITNNSKAYEYIHRLSKNGNKFGVVLLSDETLEEPMFYLEDSNCLFAARNYFSPKYYQDPKVFTFPLGYRHCFEHFVKETKKASDRRLAWSFAGSLKADRSTAINCFTKLRPYQLNVCESFNDPKQLTTQEYAQVMADSVFAIAPQGGYNIDSFRIYEALEAGTIPVVMNSTTYFQVKPSYWHVIFQGEVEMPFVRADSWDEAADKCAKIIHEGRLDEVQAECRAFWDKWKDLWRKRFCQEISKFSLDR